MQPRDETIRSAAEGRRHDDEPIVRRIGRERSARSRRSAPPMRRWVDVQTRGDRQDRTSARALGRSYRLNRRSSALPRRSLRALRPPAPLDGSLYWLLYRIVRCEEATRPSVEVIAQAESATRWTDEPTATLGTTTRRTAETSRTTAERTRHDDSTHPNLRRGEAHR